MRFMLALAAIAVLLACGGTLQSSPGEKTVPQKPPALRAPTQQEIAAAKKAGKVRLTLDTEKGAITLELDGAAAPVAVANFLNLVKGRFYDGMPFHRVEPGFVIQAGDPKLVARTSAGYTIPDERSPIKHTRGAIAMARLFGADGMIPNSASTQFYICLGDAPHLDTMGFTAFGKVVKGIEVIDRIAVGDKIRSAKVAQPR
ncbi:MAG TPA: peptidylprolyl isomerase [Armatimonadota bacterium]|nr:peptidylprolyl isomerase [Armatimonadota bacterium]